MGIMYIFAKVNILSKGMGLSKNNIDKIQDKGCSDFDLIYNRYADEMLSYGMGLGFNREVLKDAVQDVFFKLYVNKNLLQGVQNIKYYLFRALRNRLLDIHKMTIPTHDIGEYELEFVIQPTIVDELIGEEDRIIIQNKVKTLLALLTHRQREAIYLRFIQEMEYEEIGELLDMTPQASRKLVFRAMERMRKQDISILLLLIVMSQYSAS